MSIDENEWRCVCIVCAQEVVRGYEDIVYIKMVQAAQWMVIEMISQKPFGRFIRLCLKLRWRMIHHKGQTDHVARYAAS